MSLWQRFIKWLDSGGEEFRKRRCCWNCEYMRRPYFEGFACEKRRVWTRNFFSGFKDYTMDSLKVKDHVCSKFRKRRNLEVVKPWIYNQYGERAK